MAPPPPLSRQDSIIRIELYAKVRHAPPPICTWAESLSTQTDRISGKTFLRATNRTKFE